MENQFVKKTIGTFLSNILNLILGVASSIILTRLLGPEGKGIYVMAALLSTIIVTFIHLGIGPATVYYVAQKKYSYSEIFGNNIILAFVIGSGGVLCGLFITFIFNKTIFPGVAQSYLLLALPLIPLNLLFSYLQNIFLGDQKIKEYNLITIIHSILFLAFIVIALWALKIGITGALLAGAFAFFIVDMILFFWTRNIAGGVSFKFNSIYCKDASIYGIQAHLGNILGFLNYRIDMFFVNSLLSPVMVGFYSVGVGLVEKLWLISYAAGTVLFPMVAAEPDEQQYKNFTPLVTRTVFLITTLGAVLFFFMARWIVVLLYSEAFLSAVQPLKILLPGIIALSVWRLLANDMAGRGRVMLNNYAGSAAVLANVILNIILIPLYGIKGAALASTVSYIVALTIQLILYCRVSGNSWTKVLFPQVTDWLLYMRIWLIFTQWSRKTMKTLLQGAMP